MKKYLSLVKFSHTIFAMPFAMVGLFWGLHYLEVNGLTSPRPWWQLLMLVTLCMVFARNAAMAFNRYIDRDIDALNNRTQQREIPAGILSPSNVALFTMINAGLFIATTWWINELCFYLSPVALLVILGYSLTKRFTVLCHLILGLGISLAPVGAFLAVTGRFEWEPIILGIGVLTWVSGFDIIYALQDEEFDRSNELSSLPAWLGKHKALLISTFLHVITASMILLFGWEIQAGIIYWIGAGIFILMLIYQHRIVSPNDLSKVNLAFFTTNGFASLIFGLFTILEMYS